jgi:hypothetical protein
MAQQLPPARDSGRGSGGDVGADRVAAPPGSGAEPPAAVPPRLTGAPLPTGDRPGRVPFAWQRGSRLLLLEPGPIGWVLAELRFDPVACHYVEVRRARYRWAREATGALLSRVLAEGNAVADRTDRDLRAWLVAH